MQRTALSLLLLAGPLPAQLADPATDNPAVTPGIIRWHESLAHATAAATESNRPVLLFQLLGRLDRELC
jgi:hypothetical protein